MEKRKILMLGIITSCICIIVLIGLWILTNKICPEYSIPFLKNKWGYKEIKEKNSHTNKDDLNASDKEAREFLAKKNKYYPKYNKDDLFDQKRETPPLDDYVIEEVMVKEEAEREEKHTQQAKFLNLNMGKAFRYDLEKGVSGEITYELEEPARVSIRVMAKGTRELCLRTITDWELQKEGLNTVTWDGRDSSGNMLDPKKIIIRTRAEPLRTYNPGSMPLEDLTVEELVYGHVYGHNHNEHHEYACKDIKMNISNIVENEVMNGKKVIQGKVEKERRGYGDLYGYGVRYYVDYQLVHEEFYKPGCDGSFSYELDTTAFENGEHIISVGTCDHNDHVGSSSINATFNN